jgi:hypothetical protein
MKRYWLLRDSPLVRRIKEKEWGPIEKYAREQHEQRLINKRAPAFWSAMANRICVVTRDLKIGLGDHVSILEEELNCSFDAQTEEIMVSTKAFPFISFKATPHYATRYAGIYLEKADPVHRPNSHIPAQLIQGCFELTAEEIVSIQLDGVSYHEPDSAAENLIQRMFSVW